MANLIVNNSKLIEQQQKTQDKSNQTQISQQHNNKHDEREPKVIEIVKDHSGFGFNVRGQISGK
jgi:hypothetical protein